MKEEFAKLEEKAKQIEKQFGTVENYAIQTTNCIDRHTLRIERQMFFRWHNMEKIYQQLEDLQFVDLLDFQKQNW
ncbi:MAG: hypothetical protein IJX00_00650 [Clostridia bacterium]|nr:hypothetical protein [Clostridia bacterium]